MEFQYLPFPQIQQTPAVVVDSFHPNGLVLSHWRGAPTPDQLREDTSAGIVLQALRQQWPALANYSFVTANHFDVDGFVGVWALLHPKLALEREELLRQMAIIGDFRELDLDAPFAEEALKLVCWINAEEKSRFYPPFGAGDLEESEVVASIPKFHYFLEAFTHVLHHPENYRHIWQEEYELVKAGYAQLHGSETTTETHPELGLIIIHTPQPVHYYALFSLTRGYDLVLSQYADNRYELEGKYTTWVDLGSRKTLPRPSFIPLAQLLNSLETSGQSWQADGPTDTGPLLRIDPEKLRKAQRYAHPFERPIFKSSLPPAQIAQVVVSYLRAIFKGTLPKQQWTWEEIKAFNKKKANIEQNFNLGSYE